MPSRTAVDPRARVMKEAELLDHVRTLARGLSWLCYHTHRSDRSEPGFPDLVLIKAGRMLVRELKREGGRTTPAQNAWLAAYAQCGVDTGIWTPTDLVNGTIARELTACP